KSNRSASEAGLASFAEMLAHDVVRIEATRIPDMMAASRLALDLGHPLKDCIYLALAMKMGCELLTCDLRFATKARGTWTKIRVLEG
ncbi:MAG: type II toxin-antitoxin system VapC family toxin, partial [Novosphingobium sp.]|nr:type II toxin-antitoxin system VapC family toxin [Novosphingobium sp.]